MTLAKVATMKAQERKINSASSSVCGWLSSFPFKALSEGILNVLALSLFSLLWQSIWVEQCQERGCVWIHDLRVQSIMYPQEHEAASHMASTLRRQREMNAGPQSESPPHWMLLPTCRVGFLISINLLRNSLTDMPKGLFPWWFSVPSTHLFGNQD